ncbi:MAG: ATP-binding cassette domain-containing protein [Bifidobacteriaceae bacterium]|jgi:ABC-2 type transport system ATP-binding protein|nr:ATP-binding cassette domain-containing protein [Bifidobacteriaceae bacterium]
MVAEVLAGTAALAPADGGLASRAGGGIMVRGLTKRYGSVVAVDDVSFDVPRGSVTGFFGPNGSGKTTTMRLMLGLARPARGSALFDGRPIDRIGNPARVVGAVLDAGAAHAGRTVAETVRLVCLAVGLPKARGEEMIETVGLASVRGRRVAKLSLGMRQRLALACALVPDPTYLLADEPMNGLDPEGIDWLRQLLAALATAGKGVLVSTHLIGEIDDLAEHVVLIDRGRIVAAERKQELLGQARVETLVRSADAARLGRALAAAGIEVGSEPPFLRCGCDADTVGQVAAREGIALSELRPVEASLREFVLDNTRGQFRGKV